MELGIWTVISGVGTAIKDHEAVVDGERRFTFGELLDRSSRFAAVLAAHGLGVTAERETLAPWQLGQSTVGLLLRNGVEYLEATLGGYAARTATFNVNHSYVAAELHYLFDDADAAALVYHSSYAPLVKETLPLLRRRPLLIQVADDSGEPLLPEALDYSELLRTAPAAALPIPNPDDVYLMYTGGTTGMPKGVLWRQGDVWAGTLARGTLSDATLEQLVEYVAARKKGRVLTSAPLMHGSGLAGALAALAHGDTVVLATQSGRLDARQLLGLIESEAITSTTIVGDAYATPLLRELGERAYDTSSLRLIVTGGAPLAPRLKAALLEKLPSAKLVELLMATETGNALERTATTGSGWDETAVFRPLPDVAILSEDLTHVLSPGAAETGWFAKSGRLPLGYLGDEAKTAATFRTIAGTRWSIPGDRARHRADGLVEVLGRDSATINTGGEKVFAEEVELAIAAVPGVRDIAVSSRPSPRWGQEVVAIVALDENSALTDEDIKAGAATRLARYKLPKDIIRVPAIRRTGAGKIDRVWARETACAEA
ncbi:AMP-binding protein [Amycolatopsis jejuensis]|uniref:AMP-binding protein n=1 Tax=Amycolatopsis jejuensis TaxID=330084 RepID=UPI00068FB48B|nr:AMP-binding protein [Amycolatopsis jejuensis]